MALTTPVQERRQSPRSDALPRFGIQLLQPQGLIAVSSVNLSEGGLCVRLDDLHDPLEVRSLVRLQLTPARTGASEHRGGERNSGRYLSKRVECTGRVAWVIQRLDLRSSPPFPFDVGIEFVDPPPALRQFLAQRSEVSPPKGRAVREKRLESVVIRGRHFIPRLEREPTHSPHWHLIVSVAGTPCFSGHYPSDQAAMAAWITFKRRQARR